MKTAPMTGNPAMSPHAEGRKAGTHNTDKDSGKRREGQGRGNNL